MARIMDFFDVELDDYCKTAEGEGFMAEFYGNKYPPKVVLTQDVEPMFVRAADGTEWVGVQARITIIGNTNGEIVMEGNCRLTKKALNNLIKKGMRLMELYLHGLMQEEKELEWGKGTDCHGGEAASQ